MPSVRRDVATQRRDFERAALEKHGHRAVRDSGRDDRQARASCPRDDDARLCRGREIDIADGEAHKGVAHRTADDSRFLAVAIEHVQKARKIGSREKRGHRIA